eukprot:scaffold3465_cov89-Skeletonema_dohrnii-CCMP3373.AAC.9
MGQEASVPQRIGDELSSSSSASTKAANAIRGANDAAAAAVAAANNAAASVFVGQSSSSSSQPQSQQQQYAVNNNINNGGGGPTMSPTAAATGSSSSSSIMSRSGISSMIQSAKRLSVRTNASGAGGGESSTSTDAINNTTNNNVNSGTIMNGGGGASPLHQQQYYYNEAIHHGELSPKSQAIMMQQQQQRQMGLGGGKKKKNHHHKNQQQQQLTQQQLIQQQYYQQQQQQLQHSNHTPPFSSAQSTPYHTPQGTPQGSINNTIYNVMGDGVSNISNSDAQTVHTTNVTTTSTTSTTTTTATHHNLAQGMASLSLNSNSHHGGGSTKMAAKKMNKGLSAPASPRALALNKMKDNDEDDWAKAWAEDSGSDDDDDEEEDEEEGGGGGGDKIIGGGGDQLPPSMPVLTGQGAVMGQHQHQQQQQLHQPQQQYIQQQARPAPYTTPGQPQPKELPPTDRIVQQQLFTSPPPQQQQQQYQQQQQQAIMGDEDAKLLLEADQALLKDGGSWDPYCADESVEEKPCVEMFDPALRVLGRGCASTKTIRPRPRRPIRNENPTKISPGPTETNRTNQNRTQSGELFFHLSRYRRFQEPVARFYAAELMLAIGHLHKHGVIYRDLKPENVLLDAYGHVKLGDFGLAKDGIRHPTQGAKSTCGTPEYMAPEVLNQQGHGFCVDYWGLGMILFEMMTGLPPWYTTDRAKLFRRLRSAPLIFPNEISFTPNCKTCIAGLLERDPRLRIGVLGLRSAMRHEFFHRKINFEALRARQISAPIRPCEGWRQFQSRSNSIEPESKGWHSANPSLDSAAMGNITAEALDVATANFDDSFRRMPIETEDFEKQQQAQGHPPISEKDLNAQTFRGFTFDGDIPGDGPPREGPPRDGPPSTDRRQNPPNDLRGELT